MTKGMRTQAAMLETLEGLEAREAEVTLKEISAAHELSPSECRRLLDALVKKEIVTGGSFGYKLVGVAQPKQEALNANKEDEILTRRERRPSTAYFGYYASKESAENEALILGHYHNRFGCPPESIEWTGSAYLLGPVPQEFVKG